MQGIQESTQKYVQLVDEEKLEDEPGSAPKIPKKFLCPISGYIMENPVFLAGTSLTYDKSSLDDWFDKHPTELPDHNPVKDDDDLEIIPSKKLRKQINEFKKKHQKHFETNQQKEKPSINENTNDEEKKEEEKEEKKEEEKEEKIEKIDFSKDDLTNIENQRKCKSLECECGKCKKEYCKDKTLMYACTYENCLYQYKWLCLDCGKSLHNGFGHDFRQKSYAYSAINTTIGIIKNSQEDSGEQLLIRGRFVKDIDSTAVNATLDFAKGAAVATAVSLWAAAIIPNTLTAGFGSIGCFVLDIIRFGIYRGRGDITGREFGRLTGKSFVKNGFMFGAVSVGAWAGAAIGSSMPVLGTIIGALIGSIVGLGIGFLSDKGIDKKFPKTDIKLSDEDEFDDLVNEALTYFGFIPEDILDDEKFNEKELGKRYRRRTLEAHPDKIKSDEIWRFYALTSEFGLLLGLSKRHTFYKKDLVKQLKKKKNFKRVDYSTKQYGQ